MAYDNNFYRMYEEYLNEPQVRTRHRQAWKMLGPVTRMVELGCGGSSRSEALRMSDWRPDYYVGIDMNVKPLNESDHVSALIHLQGDYRYHTLLDDAMNAIQPDTVISLFSSEITAPVWENYKLYRNIFREYPSVTQMLVSGFYYTDKKGQNPIEESGGIKSHQTLETPEEVESELFTEFRLTMPVPSRLFGPNVYEVWKLLKR